MSTNRSENIHFFYHTVIYGPLYTFINCLVHNIFFRLNVILSVYWFGQMPPFKIFGMITPIISKNKKKVNQIDPSLIDTFVHVFFP